MTTTIEEGWYVFREGTTKSYERFRVDAVRALQTGLAGLVTTHKWQGRQCLINSPGAESTLSYDHGEITCRLKVSPWIFGYFRSKIVHDVESATREVAGAVSEQNRDVFIVHGHDEVARRELSSLIAHLGLRPITLHEQDDRGLTIIEKFEHYAADCSFAFILMTPDDRAEGSQSIEAKWRSRQNVIMEMGWFMARLGRSRVVILYKGELEVPSDIQGVVYIRFEQSVDEAAERIRQRLKGVRLIQ
jgi:predicted nucleotide-binding protein